MSDSKQFNIVKAAVAITYLVMVAVNAMATALPINGITTGDVSDSFPNLFAPAGITFSIWGLIYLLLAAYTLYQFGLFQQDKGAARKALFTRIGILFSISSIVNALWIFAWHFYSIGLSLLLMLVILALLIAINLQLNREDLNQREKLFIRLPFAVYFGWITVATVANATSLLVFSGWNAFGVSEQIWAALIIVVGLIIGAVTTMRLKSYAYGLVIIWAYLGIWIKHTSATGFASQYPLVITTVIASIILMVAAEGYLLLKSRHPAV
jgi:hypothetical protein